MTMVIIMNSVSKSQFKAQALAFFRSVESNGTPLIITDNGIPTLEVRRYHPTGQSPLDLLRGSVLSYASPFDPVAEDDWDAAS